MTVSAHPSDVFCPGRGRAGFTLIEALAGFGLLAFLLLAVLSYLSHLRTNTSLERVMATRDRVLSGIRTFAGMPAAIRNSMRAADSAGNLVNPQLGTCLEGTPANSCTTGQTTPLTLYSPLVAFSPSGQVMGIQAITAPVGSSKPMRFDVFGAPCSTASPYCSFEVFTSFTPLCGPPPLPNPPPALLTPNSLMAQATCTVADVISVTYSVQIDPAYLNSIPGIAALAVPMSNSIATSVLEISGNAAQ